MIEFVQGDMFANPADVRVNTVNCVGVMGAGVALAFKRRYPDMFEAYVADCKDGLVRPGRLQIWHSSTDESIVNFPTKRHWRDNSHYEDIDSGLDALRVYLSSLGSISVTLPALGCGHGGLDWSRVSKMIEGKLGGLEAHIRVFAPNDSRRLGGVSVEEPTAEEVDSALHLGFLKLADDAAGLIFVKGNVKSLKLPWIAILPSKTPSERELRALRAVARQLAMSAAPTIVALLHSSQGSEQVAQIFSDYNIDTVLVLPFGVLTRKSIANLPASPEHKSITLASVARPRAKWSRSLFAQSAEILRKHAQIALISEPDPHWFVIRGGSFWRKKHIFYLRYDGLIKKIQDQLAELNACPIGRVADSGVPNMKSLLAAYLSNTPALFSEIRQFSECPNIDCKEIEISSNNSHILKEANLSKKESNCHQIEMFPKSVGD